MIKRLYLRQQLPWKLQNFTKKPTTGKPTDATILDPATTLEPTDATTLDPATVTTTLNPMTTTFKPASVSTLMPTSTTTLAPTPATDYCNINTCSVPTDKNTLCKYSVDII
jgi:hypothetical protein